MIVRKMIANRKSIGRQMLYFSDGTVKYDISPEFIKKPVGRKSNRKLKGAQKKQRIKKLAKQSRAYNYNHK